jgi:hypothetical protein
MTLQIPGAAAFARRRLTGAKLGHEPLHLGAIRLEGGIGRIDVRFDRSHPDATDD